MEIRIGSCSICGGDVVGWMGAWSSITPPPAPRCTSCGATIRKDVIAMTPKPMNLHPDAIAANVMKNQAFDTNIFQKI